MFLELSNICPCRLKCGFRWLSQINTICLPQFIMFIAKFVLLTVEMFLSSHRGHLFFFIHKDATSKKKTNASSLTPVGYAFLPLIRVLVPIASSPFFMDDIFIGWNCCGGWCKNIASIPGRLSPARLSLRLGRSCRCLKSHVETCHALGLHNILPGIYPSFCMKSFQLNTFFRMNM